MARSADVEARTQAIGRALYAASQQYQPSTNERLQDWRGWLTGRLVDAVAPMAYTQEPARFAVGSSAGSITTWIGSPLIERTLVPSPLVSE